jgi:hypothetical protein
LRRGGAAGVLVAVLIGFAVLAGAAIAIALANRGGGATLGASGLMSGPDASWNLRQMRSANALPQQDAANPPSSGAEPPPKPVTPRLLAGPYQDTPLAIQGRLFMHIKGTYAQCSATVVHSSSGDVVWTAGHCVYGGPGKGWYTGMVFVPAYDANATDETPYGIWQVRGAYVSPQWQARGSESDPETAARYDYAAVVVVDRDGMTLEQAVGRGATIDFDAPQGLPVQVFGYPAEKPYDGSQLYTCASPTDTLAYGPDNGPLMRWAGCGMTAGASGGGWFARVHGQQELVSDTSVGWTKQRLLAGPYLDGGAEQVYQRAEHAG